MNIYVVIDDNGIEAYTQKGLILYANKKLFADNTAAKCLKTVKEAKEFFVNSGASVTHTELLRG